MEVNRGEMDRVEYFTIGEENFPNWFNDALSRGRVKLKHNEYTGRLENVIIFTVSGKVIGKPGDVVLKTRNGVLLVPAEKAKEFGYV